MPPPEKTAKGFLLSLSKISPPVPSKILLRPRLLELIKKNEDKKLILIIGQAAQGKSTNAAAWYSTSTQRSSCWINLAPEDSDPVTVALCLEIKEQQQQS
jgi:ATP/maltotriose-dependent transcriptional regulator MalT